MTTRILFLFNLTLLTLVLGLAIAQNSGNRPSEKIISEKDGATMRLIPTGEFQMGDPFNEGIGSDERPVHTVYLDDFYSGHDGGDECDVQKVHGRHRTRGTRSLE